MDKRRASHETEISFSKLLSCAEKVLQNCPKAEITFVTAVKTGQGQIYTAVSTASLSDEQILQAMTQQQDTKAEYLLTIWKVGCLDIPSLGLREKLIALNEENADALLLLQGEGGYVVRTIGSTMPQKKTEE